MVFRAENQHCAAWGVAVADLARADPPVYVRDEGRGGWEPFLDRVSVACVEMVLSEVLLGSWKLGNACELPGELITMVESAYEQMALPEYPLWADRSIMVRWFSAPGKLLRMDGRGPYCWLLVGAGPWPIWNPSVRRSPGGGPPRRGLSRYPITLCDGRRRPDLVMWSCYGMGRCERSRLVMMSVKATKAPAI